MNSLGEELMGWYFQGLDQGLGDLDGCPVGETV